MYKPIRKIPFIPTETETDQLIAGFRKRLATFLQILKETGARCGEAWKLKWTDLNGNILTINDPEKTVYPDSSKSLTNLFQCFKVYRKRINEYSGHTRTSAISEVITQRNEGPSQEPCAIPEWRE